MKTPPLIVLVTMFAAVSCPRPSGLPPISAADSLAILEDNLDHRADIDAFFRTDPASPFVRDTSIRYHGPRWFPVDPAYRARSLLHTYEDPETVIVMGTRGEERRQVRYGYFEFDLPGEEGFPVSIRLNVYKFTPYDRIRYERYPENLSVWFTDRTTGKETYDVGRYLDVGDDMHDPNYLYTLDLNKAYNPYCAYSVMYSCAIPRKEDRIDLALRVGEMKYHE
ncbi:MAG: DUF1684 domain-containing protein [Bacteroidota bacterium]